MDELGELQENREGIHIHLVQSIVEGDEDAIAFFRLLLSDVEIAIYELKKFLASTNFN